MSSLLAMLHDINPGISSTAAADLRAALVAINRQAQADPGSIAWSLNSWWQWLDDEGYDREALREPLDQICAASIGEEALAKLVEGCCSHGDEPGGLRLLHDLLAQADADLPEQLHRLEALSLAEANELDHTAGGGSLVSKGGGPSWTVKGVLIGAVLGTGGYLLYKDHKAEKKFQQDLVALEKNKLEPAQLEHAVEQSFVSEAQQSEDLVREIDQTIHQDARLARYDSYQIGSGMVKDIAKDPQAALPILKAADQSIFDNGEDLAKYGAREIEHRALILTAMHLADGVAKDFDKAATQFLVSKPNFMNDVTSTALKRVAKKHPDFKPEMEKGGWGDWEKRLIPAAQQAELLKNPKLINWAKKDVQEHAWFRYQKAELVTEFRNAAAEKTYAAYHYFVSKEVEAAAKVAKAEAESSLSDQISEEVASLIKTSETVVHDDIVAMAEKAKAAERDAAQIVEEDVEAAGGLL